jgi:adenosine deaminase
VTYDEFLTALPKVDLHSHFLGSVPVEVCVALARRHGVVLPVDLTTVYPSINSPARPNPIYARTRLPVPVSDPAQEPDPSYPLLDVSRWVAPLFKRADDFALGIYEALKQAARISNVRYCEMFFEPTLFMAEGVSYSVQVEGLGEGIRAAYRDHHISCRLIAGINRAQPPVVARDLVQTMLDTPREEVIGIGLEDYELAGPPETFGEAYGLAKRGGLHRTAHASEHAPTAQNVVTCLDLLGCERIDHGYFVLEDDAVVARCRDQGVYFTCIFTTSRRAWRPWRRASIKAMDRAGLRITLGADDPAMFPTSLVQEYHIAREQLGWDDAKLREIGFNRIAASWMSEAEKQALRQEFVHAYDSLAGRLTQ